MRSYQLWDPDYLYKKPLHMGAGRSGATVLNMIMKLRTEHETFIKGYLPTHRVWHHPQYGCLSFGRLIPTNKDTETSKKYMLHVVAYCVPVDDKNIVAGEWRGNVPRGGTLFPTTPSDNTELTTFQWHVNGFSSVDMLDSWLSENKGLFWRTMWKSPFVDIGAGMIPDRVLDEISKGYKHLKNVAGKEINELTQKISDGKNYNQNLQNDREKLKELKAKEEALHRSIKGLEYALEANERQKRNVMNKVMTKTLKASEVKRKK